MAADTPSKCGLAMKPLIRLAAVFATAAAVLLSTPGCERRPAATAEMFVMEAKEKTNTYLAEHGDAHGKKGHGDQKGHGDKKDAAHPEAAAAPAATPQPFI